MIYCTIILTSVMILMIIHFHKVLLLQSSLIQDISLQMMSLSQVRIPHCSHPLVRGYYLNSCLRVTFIHSHHHLMFMTCLPWVFHLTIIRNIHPCMNLSAHPDLQLLRKLNIVTLFSPEQAAQSIIDRSILHAEHCAKACQNLLITQLRDTLRYAKLRSGAYTPLLREFKKDQFVCIKDHFSMHDTAKSVIFRLREVRPSGVLILVGRENKSIAVNCKPLGLHHHQVWPPCHLRNKGSISCACKTLHRLTM
jgi:hypothetical protein